MSNSSKLTRIAFNYFLPIAVGGCVVWYFVRQLLKLQESPPLTLRFEWLIPSGLLYLLAHTIWGGYWVSLLRNQGATVSWMSGIRAYFISQFGKYVPGKVWVIVLRVRMLDQQGISRPIVGVTATFEALTSMAAGALLGGLLLLILALDHQGLGSKVYLLIPLALMPLGLRGLNRIVGHIAKKRRPAGSPPWPHVGVLMLFRGLLQASLGWGILGVSLWMTIQAIDPAGTPWDWEHLGRLTAINCLAYVAGFIFLFMPAGAGARELFLQILLTVELTPALGDQASAFAVIVAIVLRLLWTVFELIAAGLLYALVPGRVGLPRAANTPPPTTYPALEGNVRS